MPVTANTVVSTLIERYPYTEDVFTWFGVQLDEAHRKMSVYALCWLEGIELDEVLSHLSAVIDETEKELDEWTEEVPLIEDATEEDFFAAVPDEVA